MPTYLVRAEAVNFSNFIEDTQDISTIRGAGLMVLHAPAEAGLESAGSKVFTGASVGMFEIDAAEEPDTEALRRKLQAGVRSEATFVVDACEYDKDKQAFPERHALLVSRNRWNQMMSPSLVLPPPAEGPCEVDRVRPASGEPMWRQGAAFRRGTQKQMRVSSATKARRTYGLDKKRTFYEEVCGSLHSEFTNDFEQIGDWPMARRLHRKIALIHLDGNKFGRISQRCTSPEILRKWSDTVQENQNRFLEWLLKIDNPGEEWLWSGPTISNTGTRHDKKNAFRIETLLWGGDEIVLVVPAWTGWWVLENFFALYGTLGGNSKTKFNPDGKEEPLSHSAGLVFCHSDAPVHRLRRLAEGMTITAKARGNENFVAYQALESFDHLGKDAFAAKFDDGHLLLRGNEMGDVRNAVLSLKTWIPRSRLHDVVASMHREQEKLSDELLMAPLARACKAASSEDAQRIRDAFDRLRSCSAIAAEPKAGEYEKTATAWLHLMELWDYVQPDRAAAKGGAQ